MIARLCTIAAACIVGGSAAGTIVWICAGAELSPRVLRGAVNVTMILLLCGIAGFIAVIAAGVPVSQEVPWE